MKEVGGTTADVGAVVRYVGKELATIRRTAQGLLVGIQDGDVATVAGERVKHAGTHRRRNSVRTDIRINLKNENYHAHHRWFYTFKISHKYVMHIEFCLFIMFF